MSVSNVSSFLDTFAAAKNKVINGDFSVWNRGSSFSYTSSQFATFTADRWELKFDGSGSTKTITRNAFTIGNPIPGYEPQYYLTWATTVAGSGGTYNILEQPVEDVRTLAGQVATISFWAKSSSGSTLSANFQSAMGSGGSGEVSAGFTSFTLTSTWTRYSVTATVPSLAGRTLGTSSWLGIRFSAVTNATHSIDLWGVQVEAGSSPTSFTTCSNMPGGEQLLCQRYLPYFSGAVGNNSMFGFSYSTTGSQFFMKLPITARTNPTGLTYSNLSHFYIYNPGFSTGTPTGITWNNGGPETFTFNVATTAGSPTIAANNPAGFVFNNSSAYLYLTGCELGT